MLVAMGGALGVAAECTAPQPPSRETDALLVALTLGSGLVGGFLAHLIAYLVVGREETVTVAGSELTIDHEILRFPKLRRRRTFETSRIVNPRAVDPTPPGKRPSYIPFGFNLAFDYDGAAVRFAAGLAGADAARVLTALTRAMSTSQRSSAGTGEGNHA